MKVISERPTTPLDVRPRFLGSSTRVVFDGVRGFRGQTIPADSTPAFGLLAIYESSFSVEKNLVLSLSPAGQGVILDRSIYSDLIFTKVVFQEGQMSRNGEWSFETLFVIVTPFFLCKLAFSFLTYSI